MVVLIVAGSIFSALLLAATFLLHSPLDYSSDLGGCALVCLLLSSIPYLVAVWRAQIIPWRKIRTVVFSIAILVRVAFLLTPFYFSDDVYRYWWEGRVQNNDFNPYEFAPDAEELKQLRDDHWGMVNHPDVTTVYPPLSLRVFRVGATIGQSPDIFKFIFMGFDLGVLFVLLRLLRQNEISESFALVWAWSPLVVLEFAGSAHSMSMAIFFFLLGLSIPKKPVFVGISFALACLSHFLAIPAVVVAGSATQYRRKSLWFSFTLIFTAFYAAFASAGFGLVQGLLHMSARWRFNGSLFEIFRAVFPFASSIQLTEKLWLSDLIPKLIGVIIMIGTYVWTRVRNFSRIKSSFFIITSLLLVSSTVHPWYIVWIIAFSCIELKASWLLFTLSVMISYVVRVTQVETGVWVELPFVRWLEYLPFFCLLAVQVIRKQIDSRWHAH